jgi:hypothetical protein
MIKMKPMIIITNRTYFVSNIDLNSNQISQLDKVNLNIFKQYKLLDKYNVTKKRYLSINQTIIKNEKKTYTDDYDIINQENNKIIMKYTKNILDDNEFPSLNKYDFEETYDEEIYEITYNNKSVKIIKNKYEMYIEEEFI